VNLNNANFIVFFFVNYSAALIYDESCRSAIPWGQIPHIRHEINGSGQGYATACI